MNDAAAENRTAHFEVRTSAADKRVLEDAAASCNMSVAEFLLDSALAVAAQSSGTRQVLAFDEASWRDFVAALDGASKSRPRLAKLLREPGAAD